MKFVVCVPRYEPESGGSIVLHKLARELLALGHNVKVFPIHRYPRNAENRAKYFWRRVMYVITRTYRPHFKTHPDMKSFVATLDSAKDAVVVYPETTSGNPLGADRYVRWFLHQPGFHTGEIGYRKGDLFFCFQKAYRKNCDGMVYGGELTVEEMFLDIYHQWNHSERSDVGYMVRKGRVRSDLPELSGRWVLDELGHRDMADAFNRCRVCYFYDIYTQYTLYCAACGCIPIVVPLPGVDKQQWAGGGEVYPGVAYGEEDIPRAIATRQALLDRMRAAEDDARRSVARFVSVVESHFSF